MTALLALFAAQQTHAFPFEERVLDHVRTLHELTAPNVDLPNLELKDRRFRLSDNPGVEPGLATLIFKQGSVSFWPDNGQIRSLQLPKMDGPTLALDEIQRRAKLVLDRFVEPGDGTEPVVDKIDPFAELYTASMVVVRKGYPLVSYSITLDGRTGQLLSLNIGRRFFDFTQTVTPKIDAGEAFRIAARTYLKHKPYGLTTFEAARRPAWSKVFAPKARERVKGDPSRIDWHGPVPPDRVGQTTLSSNFKFGWQFCTVDWVSGTPTSLVKLDFDQGESQRRLESDVNIENRAWQMFESPAWGKFEETLPPPPTEPKLGRRVLLLSDNYVMSGQYDLASGRFVVDLARGRVYLRPDRGLLRALERTVR